jgi:hypothetical protein
MGENNNCIMIHPILGNSMAQIPITKPKLELKIKVRQVKLRENRVVH